MTGVESNRGLNHRALGELFGLIKHRADADAVYTVQLSNVEIYNEELRDLFAESSEQKSLQIRQSRSKEGGVFVEGLTKTRVGTIEEAWGAIQKGEKRRSQAHTSMNIESSRSHSIVMLEVEGANPTSGRTTRGRLVLIDLAGSERVSKTEATGQQLREAQHINKSLSCLGDVISALESKAAHVPFRNSKLTHLLSSSLSKDNKAVLMVQVSPTLFNASESTCSLLFAQRAAKVELGKAQRHYSAAAKFAGVADRLKSMEAALKNADKKAKTLQKQHAAQIAKIREDTEAESNASEQKINAMEKEIKDMKKQLKHAKAVAASSEKATKEKSAASKSKLAADLERARSESEAKANDVKMLSKRLAKVEGMLRKSEADAKLYTDKIKELERKRRLSVGTSRAEAENEEEESEADLNAQLLKLQRDYKLLKRKAHAQRQKKSARPQTPAVKKTTEGNAVELRKTSPLVGSPAVNREIWRDDEEENSAPKVILQAAPIVSKKMSPLREAKNATNVSQSLTHSPMKSPRHEATPPKAPNAAKRVTFKNTPHIIPSEKTRARTEKGFHAEKSRERSKGPLGGASRIVQTPARSKVRAPRRVPTDAQKPRWNSTRSRQKDEASKRAARKKAAIALANSRSRGVAA